MQPRARSVFDLFDGKRRYLVPLFQRQYVWGEEEQWQPLMEDIVRKFIDRLDEREGPPHFLGAMVLDQIRTYGNAVPTNLVIDGQQRLMTLQVFLAAFRDVSAQLGQQPFADECQRYLQNTGIMEDPTTELYKVWPSSLDRAPFRDVISAGSREALERLHPLTRRPRAKKYDPRPAIVDCYLYYHDALSALLGSDEVDIPVDARVKAMHETLRSCLQVVTIELEGEDDPQVIFESLNARGEPLLPSDLLRNFVFWRAARNKEPQEELHSQYWSAFDEPFWREEERQGRLSRPRSDIFLQHYLTLKRRGEISIKHLYAEYKYWIRTDNPFKTVREELQEIDKHRSFFRGLIDPDSTRPSGRLARALKAFDTSTVYPLVMRLLEMGLGDEVASGIFADIESYIVRRAVCNLTAKNYNNLFLLYLSKLPTEGLTRSSFREILLGMQGDSSVWPDDNAFHQGWLNRPAYSQLMSVRVQYVLASIEEALHDAKAETIEIRSPLSVEHVLPDSWIEAWPLESGKAGVSWLEQFDGSRDKADIDATATRDVLKHSFGNLTLVTQPLNSSISNSEFAAKKPEILKHSALTLNRYFQDVEDWDEAKIIERGEVLFDAARVLWPYGR